ncbi:TonB family protein [Acinetobacter sp. SwsAc5]|uniref:energy transducer TonB n=1 Tax=Acinetobacter sp. SwsAc5 TaxID=2749438 RepID=UPI0015BE4194|nr:energy transducer TonB [Acinetobacter sp. SwsAc5]NWK51665.1 TonB family protein [Acinetobacter sp. SwsAc5]
MNQSPNAMTHTSHTMKKKVVTALAVVALGHVGVLWALGQMPTPSLKPIEKEPLKVRFVKIQEPPKPLPPQPKAEPQPEKPKPQPVKEVPVVEKPLPPPPKKVEKVQQVKKAEAPKPVAKPVEKPVERVVKPAPVATVTETKVVQAAPKPTPAPVTPAPVVPAAPKTVSIGGSGVQWSRSPKPTYSNRDLQGETRTVVVLIEANEKGAITHAQITRSSGLPALDQKILRAVRSAKFKPYKENGVAYPIRAEQPFELTLNPNG